MRRHSTKDHARNLAAMVIGARSQERSFSDKDALDQCKEAIHTTITYVLGRIEEQPSEGSTKRESTG